MAYRVELDPEAAADLKGLRAFDRTAILDTIERVLATSPTRAGQSRIKRLRGLERPKYRLRVGEFRVFYDVVDDLVYVMRVLAKAETDAYLKELGHEG